MATKVSTTKGPSAKKSAAAAPSAKAEKAPSGVLTDGIKHGQFFHSKAFALTKGQKRPNKGGGKRKGRKKADIRAILGELLRAEPQFYRHLTSQQLVPKPPIFLGRCRVNSDKELWDYYEELRNKAAKIEHTITPKRGGAYKRKQAKSETILGTAVLSWPGSYDPDNPEQARWIELSVQWLKGKYGDSVVTIAMHVEEPQVHLHALFDNEGKNVKPLMEGPAAAAAAKVEGVKGRALRDAHDNAWRAVQDDFQDTVGRHVGLGRKGEKPAPRVDMTTAHRREAKAQKQEADDLLTVRKRQAIKTIERLQNARMAKNKGRRMVESGKLTPEQFKEMFGERLDPFGTGGTGGVQSIPLHPIPTEAKEKMAKPVATTPAAATPAALQVATRTWEQYRAQTEPVRKAPAPETQAKLARMEQAQERMEKLGRLKVLGDSGPGTNG